MNYNDYELLYLIEENDEVAYNVMILKYKPIIYKFAKIYSDYIKNNGYFCSYDELVNLGIEALIDAIKSYDEERKVLFYSFFLVCLKHKYNLFMRSIFTNKNKLLTFYQELDFEIRDDIVVDPFEYVSCKDFEKLFMEYIYKLEFIDGCILMLRYNNFKYHEIVKLLDVSMAKISRVVNRAKNVFINKELSL